MTTTQKNSPGSGSGISLRVQLYGLVILIITIAFTGALWISIDSTRSYLNDQMSSHAQDAATSLGLSISPYMDGENTILVETMISAIFDSGYYQSMLLTDNQGETLIELLNPSELDGVPDWFIYSFPLQAPVKATEINNGWIIAGQLKVKSHTGVSYIKLWQEAVNNLYTSLALCLLALILAYFILKEVLTPLDNLETQAKLVSKKQFSKINKLPVTRELRTVTQAMNKMVLNIETSFDHVTAYAEKLKNDVYIDPLTQLGNRSAFENQFKIDLADMGNTDLSSIGLIYLPSLISINTNFGYQQGDDYVSQSVELIKDALKLQFNGKLYRISGGNFVFTIKDFGDEVESFCQQLAKQFSALDSSRYSEGYAHLVALSYNKSVDSSASLSLLDTLLTQENSATKKDIIYHDFHKSTSLGLQKWSQLIDEVVSKELVNLSFQPVVALKQSDTDKNKHDVLYYELFVQFENEESNLSNNQLFAMAERLNKSIELDKLLLTKIAKISNFNLTNTIALNLTHQSIHSLNFRAWLENFLSNNAEKMPKLLFEINEDALLTAIDSCIDFIHLVKNHHVQICIERFGESFTPFKYIKGLNIDYLKFDGSYIKELDKNPDNDHLIRAVIQIGHSVGIKVLAAHLESDITLQKLKDLTCDGVQGYYIQKPEPLLENNTCIYTPFKVQ